LSQAEAIVAHMLLQDAFSRWLDIRLISVNEGQVDLEMAVRHDMLNGFGRCHGGILFSLADSALAFSSNSPGRVAVSVENSIAYAIPVERGDILKTRVEEIRRGARVSLYSIRLENQQGETVALFRGTVYRTGTLHDTGNAALKTKSGAQEKDS